MKKLILSCLIIALALPAFPQGKTDVTVGQVNDRRTSSGTFSKLVINLQLPKIKTGDVLASRVLVTAATDSSGADLLDKDDGEPGLQGNASLSFMEKDDLAKPATVELSLKNPGRSASAVKEIRGEIELFMPSRDPNSVADIPKFMSGAGKPLGHKALKSNGVEITVVSPAMLEAARKKYADAKREEYKSWGYEAEQLEEAVKQATESYLKPDDNEILVLIKDPNKRIQDISFVTKGGEVKRAFVYEKEEGYATMSSFGEKPAADSALRISMKTPKNLVRYPFAVSNIALP